MIEYGFTDRAGRAIGLAGVTDENWRAVADIAPRDDQRRFVAALAARYLLLSWRGGDWNSLAVTADDAVVGHVMWAYDDGDGSHWIGGMVVDASEQGKGVGRAAVRVLARWLSERPGFREVRLSYHPDNTSAAHLYESIGFTLTGEREDDEVVAALSTRATDKAGHPGPTD
ncbi:GNAT family N-acetyltransferase [Streptomyces venezuelae]|uniref:GNAT family N-acetyltransferase n=1 Tax=Streptomyces venezuelae TaxID=54571 RepID=A0A5P2D0J4_STRVZ|nr:GNAT family N-acetyltransferase [Streptomyces venezuelae]QES48654.1 GNAT family N-acetyltransferase [Streptomyces venezuelae]